MEETEGIALLDAVSLVVGNDVILVVIALADAGDETLPHTGGSLRMQRRGELIPAVEIAGNADLLGPGGPDGEPGARLALVPAEVSAKLAIGAVVASLVEEVLIVRGENSRIGRGSDRSGFRAAGGGGCLL